MPRRRPLLTESQTPCLGWTDTPLRGYRMSTVPDYQMLCILATAFNPVLGLLAAAFNKRAITLLKKRRERHANVFYFFVFVLSVTSVTVTVCAAILGMTEWLIAQKTSFSPPNPSGLSQDLMCRDYLTKVGYKFQENDTNACDVVHEFHWDIAQHSRRPKRNMTDEQCVCPTDFPDYR